MAESYLDRPQDDNTPKAHPAFNRGKVTGVKTTIRIIKNIIDGVDVGQGVNNLPQLEAVRRAILEYKAALTDGDTKSSQKVLTEAKKLVANIRV